MDRIPVDGRGLYIGGHIGAYKHTADHDIASAAGLVHHLSQVVGQLQEQTCTGTTGNGTQHHYGQLTVVLPDPLDLIPDGLELALLLRSQSRQTGHCADLAGTVEQGLAGGETVQGEPGGREEMLPCDQHMLVAAIAPRLCYVASCSEDAWASPAAERESCRLAKDAYELYGKTGVVLPAEGEVETDKSYHDGNIGYHVKTGPHGILPEDWTRYMDFWDAKRG